MKKFLCILLMLALTLGLWACGGNGDQDGVQQPQGLQVGFGRVKVTPSYEVNLYGYGEERVRITSTAVSHLYVTTVALRLGEETALLLTLDTTSARNGIPDKIRTAASEATGVPKENIFFGCTHTHSAPSLYYNSPGCLRFQEEFYAAIGKASADAVADLAETTVSTTQFQLEGMNFVRHWLMKDGSYAGPNFGNLKAGFAGHPTDPDKTMILLKFDRPEGKEDVLLVNWQAHPANSTEIGRNYISADFVGVVREKLEKDTGMKVAYFSGAQGNLISHSYWDEENHGLSWKAYGEKLAEYAQENLPSLTPVEVNSLKHSYKVYEGTVDHTMDHLAAECKQIRDQAFVDMDKEGANEAAHALGLSSYYHAGNIVTLTTKGATSPLEMQALALGPIAFISADYEMFSDASIAIRKDAPFDATFIMVTNQTYMPSDMAFDYGSYETATTYFIRGTAETMVQEYLSMLNALK